MSDDEFDEEVEPDEEFDEEALVDDADDVDELLVDDDLEVALEVGATVADVEVDDDEPEEVVAAEDDDEIIDLDEELHPDDVEEALDVVLRERTAKVGLEEDDDEDDEPDDRGDAGTKIVPKRATEFACASCFLVKPRHMLADEKKQLCADCV